jgi:G3E family GTPase
MVGGFLGAGKTTALFRLAERLKSQGLRVGLITNDQSYGLVDTQLLASAFPVEEITGGCFCCRFQSLVEASQRLTSENQPDVFLAEPVGSCTDIKATVDYPLRRFYGDDYSVAPYSVLVDPLRAARVLGIEQGQSFSEKVLYIYHKQLEEADVLVINKTDLLTADQLARLTQALAERYPRATIRAISARDGTGIDSWHEDLQVTTANTTSAMDVDYDVYAEGESLLGWLNGQFELTSDQEFDGNALLAMLAVDLRNDLQARAIPIAHLKMTVTPDQGSDLAVVNVVSNESAPELYHRLQEPLEAGKLTLNLRAEGAPEHLQEAIEKVFLTLEPKTQVRLKPIHLESFRPGRPMPTHRFVAV